MGFRYSICHTTARPKGWQTSYNAWINAAAHPKDIEYVLCVDKRWGFPDDYMTPSAKPSGGSIGAWKVVYNEQRMCSVDGWNTAAAYSTGSVLILNADDFVPPHHWDDCLNSLLLPDPNTFDFVIETSSGNLADDRNLIVLAILSRARYNRLGYALYPEYLSMFSDNEFTEHARKDSVVIDARHLMFRHHHPQQDPASPFQWDEQYNHQNSQSAWDTGLAILNRRRAEGFPAWNPVST